MKTISFINLKGGVGKTTLATNIAYALAFQDIGKVLFIDNDKQGNASDWFGVPKDNIGTLANIMIDDVKSVKEIIRPTNTKNIDIIPADMGLLEANTQVLLSKEGNQIDIIKNAIKPVMDDYIACIIDNPPDINMSVLDCLAMTDEVIIVTTPDPDSLSGVEKMVEQLEYIKQYNPNLKLRGILVNFWVNDQNSANFMEVLNQKKLPVFQQKISYATKNARKHMTEAKYIHKAFITTFPNCQSARDMVKFFNELFG